MNTTRISLQDTTSISLLERNPQIRLYFPWEDEYYKYIAMEFVETNLFEALRKAKRFQPVRAVKYFVEVVGALKYLHAHQIIHREDTTIEENAHMILMRDAIVLRSFRFRFARKKRRLKLVMKIEIVIKIEYLPEMSGNAYEYSEGMMPRKIS
jgi:hypothetical protein